MFVFRIELNENGAIIEQPLIVCDDLRAMLEMWLLENAHGKWVIGGETIFLRNQHDAEMFKQRFCNQFNIPFEGRIWRAMEPMRTWIAFACNEHGGGFRLIDSSYNISVAAMPYMGVACTPGPNPPGPGSFSWVRINNQP